MLENNNLETKRKINYEIIEIAIFLLGLFIVYLTSFYRYLLFHSIAELFSIIITGGVFLVGWNSRKYIKTSFFLNLGASSLFIAVIDLVHTLSYTGMQIFLEFDSNLPASLWIAARYLQAASFLISSLLIRRSIKPKYLIFSYFLITVLLLTLIFNGYFPVCYIENYGLTPFKIISEYLISLILFVSLLMIIKNRTEFDKKVLILIVSSIVTTIFSELAFTFYIGTYDPSNLVGHIFKIIAFYLLYKSVIQIGIEDPFDLLFRKISRSELELRNIIKHSGAGITMLDENGIYLLVNENAAAELGGLPEDFIGKTLHDVLPQNLADEYIDSNQELIREGRRRSYQRTFELPSGNKTFWIVEQPIQDTEAKYSSLLSVATDITELRKAEVLLAEAEERYRTTFEQSPDGIIILELDTLRAVEFNDAVCNMLGYTREEFEKLKINDYDIMENQTETRLHVEKILKEGRDDFETKFRTKKGEIKDIYVTAKVITLLGKEYFQTVFRDITNRKRAEEEILNLSRFPSENPNPVLRVSKERVTYTNKIGKNLFSIDEGSFVPKVLEQSIRKALTDNEIQELDLRLNSRTYTLLINPIEKMDYVNIYGMDITERKKAEERLSQLISTVSHELRTPITVLLMSMDYLTHHKELIDEELEMKLMDGISRNLHSLNELAEDILMVSRIDENRLRLNIEKFSPTDIIAEILSLLEPVGKEKNIIFKLDIDKELRLNGDPKRIDQIFRIVIYNAIKYSSENSRVEIRAIKNYQGKYNLDGTPGVLFQFKDYGRGIPKEDQSHIFERFFRSSNVNGVSGTGLGLAIAKDLIEAHKGRIYFESEVGKGTTFHLFLPRIE